jgi:hypothetical protein
MPDIEVATLKLRCGVEERDRTRFAIEDGLRTSLPDDQRLVLVRKMCLASDVGTLQPGERQEAVRTGWLAAITGARHGGEDGAAGSNCVWFASRNEAERLLLQRLLAGQNVDAWYWRLALPDWRGQGLGAWVSGRLGEMISRGEDRRLLEIAHCFAKAGAAEELVRLVTQVEDGTHVAALDWLVSGEEIPAADLTTPAAEALAEAAAPALAGTLSAAIRKLLAALAEEGGQGREAALAIARAWALRRSPALTLSPPLVAAIAAAIVNVAGSPATGQAPKKMGAVQGRAASADHDGSERSIERASGDPRGLRSGERQRQVEPPAAAVESKPVGDEAPAPEALAPALPESAPCRLKSSHAGLWLVVPSLVRLGFREWLAARPLLLGDDPGRRLLYEIARHHRVAPDDPALMVLGELPKLEPSPDWAELWRHGLDRWLRRGEARDQRLRDYAAAARGGCIL